MTLMGSEVFDSAQFRAPLGFRVTGVENIEPSGDQPLRIVHPDPAWRVSFEPQQALSLGWYSLDIRFPPQGVVDVIAQIFFANGDQFWLRVPSSERNCFASYFRVSSAVERMTLMVSGSGYLTRIEHFSLQPLGTRAKVTKLARALRQIVSGGYLRLGSVARALFEVAILRAHQEVIAISPDSSSGTEGEKSYDKWIRLFDEHPEQHRERHVERLNSLSRQPLVSILATAMPYDQQQIERLAEMVASQTYQEWELVVVSTEQHVTEINDILISKGVRRLTIIAADTRSDVATNLNAMAAQAAGQFILQIPPGLQLRSNCLLELLMAAEIHPQADIIYADDDQIDPSGARYDPRFKPAWSPDYFSARDYIGPAALLRRQTVLDAGGWKSELADLHDHDLMLRMTDKVGSRNVIHIAKVLTHSPSSAVGVKPSEEQDRHLAQVMRSHIERRQFDAEVVFDPASRHLRMRYQVPQPPPLVSLLIPIRDRADLLQTCVGSILALTKYSPIEIIVMDNGSEEEATHRLLADLQAQHGVRVLRIPGVFNFSLLNNQAAREAKGEILGLINSDVEVLEENWLTEMVGLVVRPDVGCVGAKLLYSNRTIQHAGIYVGIGGVASHAHKDMAHDAPGYMDRMQSIQNVSGVTAACLLIRKHVYQQVGGFDETLPMGFNDAEFCLRVRAADYLNVWTPFAELIHNESMTRGPDTTPEKANRAARELVRMRQHYGEKLWSDPYYSPNLTFDSDEFSVRTR